MAAFYWIGGGANSNWNTVGNWSATSGGGSNGSTPSSTSDVIFDGAGAGGNTSSTISANITILSLTFTSGYTATVTVNATLTVAGNFTDHTAHSWAGSSNMTISATSTITSNGKIWPNGVTFTGTNTKTLSGNWVIGGTLTVNGTTTLNWTTNESLSCAGITMGGAGASSGTAKIILTGGTWSGTTVIQNNMDIQGNVTVSSGVAYNTGTLTSLSATVTTAGSTLTISASTTLNTAGVTWNNITIANTTTVTINSLLTLTGTLTLNQSAITFAGTAGFTTATLTELSQSSRTITFNDGVTYTITTALNAFNSRTGSILTFTSDDATNLAIFDVKQGCVCNVLANFTRIDASPGRPILSFNGTITGCKNVFAYTDVKWKPVRGAQRSQRRLQLSNKDKAVEYL